MNAIHKRLLALNLALLLLLTCALTAAAAEPQAELTGYDFIITVDGFRFPSSMRRAGDGWVYDPDGEVPTLTLTDYDGGPITASGDLRIYTEGDVTIRGNSWYSGNYGSCGIEADADELTILTLSGTLTVIGGSGTITGGYGVANNRGSVIYEGSRDTTATFVGGAGTGDKSAGGDAFFARETASIGGPGTVASTGGDGLGMGGAGMRATSIAIDADAEINGSTYSCGMYANKLSFGLVDATIYGYGVPIHLGGSDPSLIYDKVHCTLTAEGDTAYFRTNRYTLTLDGGSAGTKSIPLRYGSDKLLALGDYRFERDDAAQWGWTSDGTVLPLNALYQMEYRDTTLSAAWRPFSDITVIREGGEVTATISDAWTDAFGASYCIVGLYEGDRQLAAAVGPVPDSADTTIRLTYTGAGDPVCRIYTLDSQFRPLTVPVEK
ncbi:MAG: hypothetical protein E7423_04210 [Ruminococcaceae bacterium]|nr:hypothetical protein [Oscillospiraceae bacterium]